LRLFPGLGAKPVIDGCRVNLIRPGSRSEQEKGETVRPAGNGNAQANAGIG